MSEPIQNKPFKLNLEDFSRMMAIDSSEIPLILPLEEDTESALRNILAPLEAISSLILESMGKVTDEKTEEVRFLMALGILIRNTVKQVQWICMK